MSSVGVYTRHGIVASTTVLLPIDAAKRLFLELQGALSSSEAIALASWPRKVCSFSVSPHTRGKVEEFSLHLDSGPKPYSIWEIRRRAAFKAVNFVFWVVGVIASVRWIWIAVGA